MLVISVSSMQISEGMEDLNSIWFTNSNSYSLKSSILLHSRIHLWSYRKFMLLLRTVIMHFWMSIFIKSELDHFFKHFIKIKTGLQ